MMLQSSTAILLAVVLSGGVFVYWILPFLNGLLFAPTKRVPGPFWARLTRLYEVYLVHGGNSHLDFIKLHEKYGT